MSDDLPLRLVRDLHEPFESRRALARAAVAGTQERVARGVYLAGTAWESMTPTARYRAHVLALARTRRNRPVLSHWSAAALHGLPLVGAVPDRLHVTVTPASGGRSSGMVVRHSARLREKDVTEIDGVLVTSIVRTVVDLAAEAPVLTSVCVVDRALLVDRFGRRPPLCTAAELLECWESMLPLRAFARARAAIQFGATRSESALESVSRVNMRIIGVPQPVLQLAHSDARGPIGDTDFAWPAYDAAAEADGLSKYLDAELRAGLSAEQVVVKEKLREDRVRAVRRAFTRWGWSTGIEPRRLREKLVGLGLPTGIRW